MLPSPLSSMPPLAAAATEHRINGTWSMEQAINPNKNQSCTVRLRGDITVRYRVRAVGGSGQPTVCQEAPRRFERCFVLHDDQAFFRSYTACGATIHGMIAETIGSQFDLAADNWDNFLPHELAAANVGRFRRKAQELRGVTLRYSMAMTLTISVDVIFDEPKAMLIACMRWVAQGGGVRRGFTAAECCVCMEGLAPKDDEEEDAAVRLPCSHAFHRECIAPWFYRVATCPMCRHDMSKYLVFFTNTPRGKFPGLQTQIIPRHF